MKTGNQILSGLLLLGVALPLRAAPTYEIERTGLTGAGYERSDGYHSSSSRFLSKAGHAAGYSERYGGTASLGQDAWLYNGAGTLQLGFTGVGYERSDGYRYSDTRTMNTAGRVAGYSKRYSGLTELGQDAWLYTGSNTVQPGFTGTGYEQKNGYRVSYVNFLNEAGQAAGASVRYSATTSMGQDAWLYTGSNTVQLGFTGTDYLRSNGYRASYIQSLNKAGHATGYSERFNGLTDIGADAWLYTGSGTVQLGFTGTGYERSNGTRGSYTRHLNEAGQVAGDSRRYSATTYLGQDAWLYTGSSTVQLGFTGTGYEQNDGFRNSAVAFLNEAGHAAGSSERYSGWINLGRDAWLYDGSNVVWLGFTGTGYEQKNGYRVSYVNFLNEAGQAAGASYHYNGNTNLGRDAWLYDGSGTVQIGLIGAVYERKDGYRVSDVQFLNDAGHVAGSSERYDDNGIPNLGRDVWLYNGSNTAQIGLTGAGYERSDGGRASSVVFLNDAGQAAGASSRFSGMTSLGSDAWLYDAALDQLFTLSLSTRQSDGYAFSEVEYLGDDGLVLGRYKLFDPTTDTDLGYRAFVFSEKDGLFDLSSLVMDLVPDGWENLASAFRANGIGNIIGYGTLDGPSGQAAYILTPASAPVPVPAVAWLLAGAFGGLGVRAIRHKTRAPIDRHASPAAGWV